MTDTMTSQNIDLSSWDTLYNWSTDSPSEEEVIQVDTTEVIVKRVIWVKANLCEMVSRTEHRKHLPLHKDEDYYIKFVKEGI